MLAAAAGRVPEEPPMRSAEGAVQDWFKFRTTFQQFMRENEPLFRALASLAEDPFPLMEGGGFGAAAGAAKEIAVSAARQATGKAEPAAHEIRPFRTAAAAIAAASWRAGGLATLDSARLAGELAACVSIVDEDLDRSVFRETNVSDEASLAMTSAAVSLRLLSPVMTYDFRRDRAETVAAMSGAVVTAAAEAARDVLPENAKPEDRRSVFQTLANCLSTVMAEVYERKARHYVSHVAGMGEAERESFARRYDPMPEVLRGFRENSKVYAGAAFAAARAAAEAAGTPPGPR